MAHGKNQKKRSLRKKRLLWRRLAAIPHFLLAAGCGAAAYYWQPRLAWMPLSAAAGVLLIYTLILLIRKQLPKAVYYILGAIGLLLLGFSPLYYRMVPFYETTITTNARILRLKDAPPDTLQYLDKLETLDIRNSTITDFEPFLSLTTLKKVDVRGNYAFTQSVRDRFAEALPDCDVLWSIYVDDRYYDSDTEEIDLRNKKYSVEKLNGIFAEHPQFRYRYRIDVFGQRVDDIADSLTLNKAEDFDYDQMAEALTMLPAVKTIDLTVMPFQRAHIEWLEKEFPSIDFRYTYDTPLGVLTGAETELAIDSYETLSATEEYFRYLPDLKTLDLRKANVTQAQVDTLKASYPDMDIIFSMSVYGVKCTSKDTGLNLSKKKITELDTLKNALKYMPNLKKINMCDCGISNSIMGKLQEAYPDIKFVWRIHFGKWSLRTDATAFSTRLTSVSPEVYYSSTFEPLKYCTDLMFLDLGHNYIKSISFLRGLTKMRALILSVNNIKNLGPLAGMTDLEYLEVFTNPITSVAPLANMTKLLDLNISCTKVNDATPLYGLTNLERCWVSMSNLSNSAIKKLRKALPNCNVNTSAGNNPTGGGWRNHKRYYIIKEMYKKEYYIPFS